MTEHLLAARALNGATRPLVHALADEGEGGTADGAARDAPLLAGGIPALERDPMMFAALRREVEETTLSYAAIGRRFGLARGSLHRFAGEHGWRRPEGAPIAAQRARPAGRRLAKTIDDGEAVTARLLRVVDRQINTIDTRLRRKETMIDEKDARLLVHLAKTLQTIMALGRDGGAGTKEPADRGEPDADLARRIALWAEGREEA